ncbi:MAG TPA: hypothetical protein H9775_15305, partial [Candidatus Blautia merdipullorum]|nr:hypothetical protein [Candidatus Blautia merdipullorum]
AQIIIKAVSPLFINSHFPFILPGSRRKASRIQIYFLFHLSAQESVPDEDSFLILLRSVSILRKLSFPKIKKKGVQNAPAFQTPSF